MAQLIRPNGEVTEVTPKNKKYFTLTELQKLVGGLVQPVRTKDGRIMATHEEAKMYEEPINWKATALYIWGGSDVIAGTVVVGTEDEIMLDA